METKNALSGILSNEQNVSRKTKLILVMQLSLPAILSQLTSIIMQYIDAAMVGKLGASASASIGIVSTSTWLLSGLCSAIASGFAIQVAHHIGANQKDKARNVVLHGLMTAFLFSLILLSIGAIISRPLPEWLSAESSLRKDASLYFLIYVCSLPFLQLSVLSSSFLQCSGDMKTPSILNASMCALDVFFNWIFIRHFQVAGAALGTALAQAVIALIMTGFMFARFDLLKKIKTAFHLDSKIITSTIHISIPMAIEHVALCGAMIASTRIIAPLGTVAIAANSFAITAESLCYMPGYGIASAATTLVGQSAGAKRIDLVKSFSNLSILLGVVVMSLAALIMYAICPVVFEILTPDRSVQQLATSVLRIELFAEPFYAMSIVASGALRGAKDTLIPSLLNLISIWGVRIPLSIYLVSFLGLYGAWVAMGIELCARGILLMIRQQRKGWLKKLSI